MTELAQRGDAGRALSRVRTLCERRLGVVAGSGAAAALMALGYALFPWSPGETSAAAAPAPVTTSDMVAEAAELPLVAQRLKTRLAQSPNDGDGWALLARTHVRLGQYGDGVQAFRRAIELRPADATLLAECADVMATLNHHSMEGEPSRLVARALQIDPANPAALFMAGMVAFDRNDFGTAIGHWEQLQPLTQAGTPAAAQVRTAIAEARRRLQLASN